MRLFTAAAACLAFACAPIEAVEPRLDVNVVPHVAVPEPGIVRVTALVAPDDRNRHLVIEIDSTEVYRRSERPLNGSHARRRHLLVLGELPAGQYEIRVHLVGTDGEITEVRSFRVRSDDAGAF